LGIRQANLLGKSLQSVGVDYIACSTLTRAIQTTEIVKKEIGLDIEIETFPGNPPFLLFSLEGLEEMHYGEWEGKP
jgi:broad specificity phosphatase PhoE